MRYDLCSELGRAQAYASGAEGAALVQALEHAVATQERHDRARLADALQALLDCQELQSDDLQPLTRHYIEQARRLLPP